VLEQDLQGLAQVRETNVAGPRPLIDQPRRKEHLDGHHRHLFHALTGDPIGLACGDRAAEGESKVLLGPLPVAAHETVPEKAKPARRAEVYVDGEHLRDHGIQPHGGVHKPVEDVVTDAHAVRILSGCRVIATVLRRRARQPAPTSRLAGAACPRVAEPGIANLADLLYVSTRKACGRSGARFPVRARHPSAEGSK